MVLKCLKKPSLLNFSETLAYHLWRSSEPTWWHPGCSMQNQHVHMSPGKVIKITICFQAEKFQSCTRCPWYAGLLEKLPFHAFQQAERRPTKGQRPSWDLEAQFPWKAGRLSLWKSEIQAKTLNICPLHHSKSMWTPCLNSLKAQKDRKSNQRDQNLKNLKAHVGQSW